MISDRDESGRPDSSRFARKPLIAHVIFRLGVGGLENGLVNLINHDEHGRFRHAIICIDSATDFGDRVQRDDVSVIAINKRPGFDLRALLRLYRVFRQLRPDIVHTRNLGALDAVLPAFLAGVPARIHSEHGWDVQDVAASNVKYRWIRKLHSPFISHYIALSSHLQVYLTERVGISSSRVTRIVNGVDSSRFAPTADRCSLRARLLGGVDDDRLLVGTVSRLDPVKDPLNLVAAFACLLRREPDLRSRAKLVIVGDGELRPELEREVGRLLLSDVCLLLGERDDVPALLQCLDIFVMSSLAEGISNTILEAMATGLPVVATEVGGTPEIVLPGTTGALVPAGDPEAIADALARYANDRALMRNHGAAGRRAAQTRLSIREMVRRYFAVYDRYLPGPALEPGRRSHRKG